MWTHNPRLPQGPCRSAMMNRQTDEQFSNTEVENQKSQKIQVIMVLYKSNWHYVEFHVENKSATKEYDTHLKVCVLLNKFRDNLA